MIDIPWTKTAEEKLLEYSFAIPSASCSIIQSLAEQTAKRNGHATVTVYIVKAAYRHWYARLRDKAVQP